MTCIFCLWDEIFQRGGGGNGQAMARGPGVKSRCSFLPVGECVCVSHRRFVHEDSKGWVLTYPMYMYDNQFGFSMIITSSMLRVQ